MTPPNPSGVAGGTESRALKPARNGAMRAARFTLRAFAVVFSAAALLVAGTVVYAGGGKSLIRDAEIETILRSYSDPIFISAGIEPSSVRIFIVGDPEINAFVAGGLNMFIHTGLILATENAGMLIGVIAHETGHIAGAHLTRLSQHAEGLQLGGILSSVLGTAVLATGDADLGGAIIAATRQVLERDMLAFYRGNEQAADQAALNYLDANNISASGMVEMFEVLQKQERQRVGDNPNPYNRTHPLSRERLRHVKEHASTSPIAPGKLPPDFAEKHERMLAKLRAFLEPPKKIFERYPASNTTLPARYARAIAHFRARELKTALAQVDALIQDHPQDPFFQDLKGQILYENGLVADAVAAYRKANALLPDHPLILTDLGKALIATGTPENLKAAIEPLEIAKGLDNSNASTWRHLAIAYGRTGQIGMSHLALAEEAALRARPKDMQRQITLAQAKLDPSSPAYLRTEDLQAEAKRLLKEQEAERSLF